MRRLLMVGVICVLALGTFSPTLAEDVDAASVLERLKALAGTWNGERQAYANEDEAATRQRRQVTHEFRVSGGGSLVMETMFQGTEHEMINMFHLDGDELVLTHYCAGGNQPSMRLDRARSTPTKLIFDFAGGTNLDPAVDDHIHSAEIVLADDGRIHSTWTSYSGGESNSVTRIDIARSKKNKK